MILLKLMKILKGVHGFLNLKMKDQSEMDTLMNKEEYDKFAKESQANVT